MWGLLWAKNRYENVLVKRRPYVSIHKMAAEHRVGKRGELKMGRSKFPGKPSKCLNRRRVNLLNCQLPEDNEASQAAENICLGLTVFNQTFGDSEQVRKLASITRLYLISPYFASFPGPEKLLVVCCIFCAHGLCIIETTWWIWRFVFVQGRAWTRLVFGHERPSEMPKLNVCLFLGLFLVISRIFACRNWRGYGGSSPATEGSWGGV